MKKIVKKLYIFLCIICMVSSVTKAQTEDFQCLTPVDTVHHDPDYLTSNWGQSQTIQLAVIYFDFPDGRWNDNGTLKQPVNINQLQLVSNLDAVGEVGLTNTSSPFVVTDGTTTLYTNAAKYSWQDRFNMFFSTGGVYLGSAHPDYSTHYTRWGDKAYGSMREYFSEISNSKLDVIPATTHPNLGASYQGIVNDFVTLPGGKQVIDYITLPRNKYGPESSSYMPSYAWYTYTNPPDADDLSRIELMRTDMIDALRQRYISGQTTFNYDNFIAAGGKCIFVFAGSSYRFKGLGPSDGVIVRNMNAKPDELNCKIDGISNMAHEFGHSALGWGHTYSGRYDLMNVWMTRDINCPSHVNPIFKLKKGWLDAIPYEHSMSVNNLPPIETSKKCGIVTIYGKPTVSPDHLAGECFILENRKRIGFDEQLVTESLNDFKGGLLIWHYSPYTPIIGPSCNGSGLQLDQKVVLANGESYEVMCGSIGNPRHFFAHSNAPGSNPITTLPVSETYSRENLKTGIQITNIAQNDYNDVNSNISFNLQYTISEPPDYEHVIFNRGNSPALNIITDKVYYHEYDPKANYIIYENSQIEGVASRGFTIGPFKSRTHDNNPILFKGAGYNNLIESHINKVGKIECRGTPIMDSVVVENIKLENLDDNVMDFVALGFGPNTPTVFRNITPSQTDINDKENVDIYLVANKNISKVDLSNANVYIYGGSGIVDNSISINNGNLKLDNTLKFNHNGGIVTQNSTIFSTFTNQAGITLTSANPFDTWAGIQSSSGNVLLDRATITNARRAVDASTVHQINIVNCTFNNSITYDIILQNAHPDLFQVDILNNVFNCNSNYQYSSIACSDIEIMHIQSNYLNDIGQFGITVMNSPYATIYGNIISGANSNDGYSTGIFGYSCGGWINCNEVRNCLQYGVLLDNSIPVLYSNIIENNGIGLHLTNNSHPIMAPAYTPNQTFEIGGMNQIRNSFGPEIYCDNEPKYNSTPILDHGSNMIEDFINSGGQFLDTLIFNSDISTTPPIIYCTDNEWGNGNDPGYRLVPYNSFSYRSYLAVFDPLPCGFGVIEDDNTEIPQSQIMLGSYMVANRNNNFNGALEYANNLYSLSDNNISKIISLNGILYSSILGNANLLTLEAFYQNVEANNSNLPVISTRARDLRIETKVEEENLTGALNDYENIINTSQNDKEIFYANINKSRVNRLIIDSILAHYNGGDNFSSILSAEDQKFINKIFTDTRTNIASSKIKNIFLKKLNDNLKKEIENSNGHNTLDKKSLLLSQSLVNLAIKNYNPNIGSIVRKESNKSDNVIGKFELAQNYPNPFNPLTTIKYSLPKASFVSIKVYDVVGRMVKELVNEFKEVGNYNVNFDGSQFASGVYFYRIEANNFVDTKRMVLIK